MMDVYQVQMQNCRHVTSRPCPFLNPTAPVSFPLYLLLGMPCVRALRAQQKRPTGEEKAIHDDAGSSRVRQRKGDIALINKQSAALQLLLVANH
ncbi:hypothetical protein [Phaeobacter sp. B1627]|uniref:hypothetical protein n=1 Tax=Phaeobacter sp. B1627 TaxID=2583809 RepID=UPI00111985FE|nr:hypothetical protein [Phaeobacter sp. B1627]TNJ40623.1 hypothetical protein FGE21_17310 [Phaeobacter sp. B1627]